MLCVSLKRDAKSLLIVLPIGWAVIKTKKNQFKSRFSKRNDFCRLGKVFWHYKRLFNE